MFNDTWKLNLAYSRKQSTLIRQQTFKSAGKGMKNTEKVLDIIE